MIQIMFIFLMVSEYYSVNIKICTQLNLFVRKNAALYISSSGPYFSDTSRQLVLGAEGKCGLRVKL